MTKDREAMHVGPGSKRVTLPYASPKSMGETPPTPGISAVIPLHYTIVDTRTLGGAAKETSYG